MAFLPLMPNMKRTGSTCAVRAGVGTADPAGLRDFLQTLGQRVYTTHSHAVQTA